MIFDIYGKQTTDGLIFDIPSYHFNKHDSVAVTRLIIKWKSNAHKFVAELETDLVTSYRRQILTFSKSTNTSITDICIQFPVFFEVYEDNLENASFSVNGLSEEIPDIEYLYLQLLKK